VTLSPVVALRLRTFQLPVSWSLVVPCLACDGTAATTQATQDFIVESRSAATRRCNILTASLSADIAVALSLAALAFWQRSCVQPATAIHGPQTGLYAMLALVVVTAFFAFPPKDDPDQN
jgi:hypothetical protein